MFDAQSIYGVSQAAPASAQVDTSPGIAVASLPTSIDQVPMWSLQHPLAVFALLLAAAAGLVGFATSTSGHVGPASASGSIAVGKK